MIYTDSHGKRRRFKGGQIYREKDTGAYLLAFGPVWTGRDGEDCTDAIANVYPGNSPSLVGTTAQLLYLREDCTRVTWSKLPEQWQEAFRPYLPK